MMNIFEDSLFLLDKAYPKSSSLVFLSFQIFDMIINN